MKQCIVEGCFSECTEGRRYCRAHYLERKRQQAKSNYRKRTTEHRIMRYKFVCVVCGSDCIGSRRDQKYCSDCYAKLRTIGKCGENNYENAKGGGYCWMHRRLAEQTLKRKLNTNEVVHHLDGDPKNNSLDNLIVLSRSKHASLHSYLRTQGAILSKGSIENLENCWKDLIAPMTTAWLETTNAKVIKLWEIGQSAAEPLEKEEGSETMHEAAKCSSTC